MLAPRSGCISRMKPAIAATSRPFPPRPAPRLVSGEITRAFDEVGRPSRVSVRMLDICFEGTNLGQVAPRTIRNESTPSRIRF